MDESNQATLNALQNNVTAHACQTIYLICNRRLSSFFLDPAFLFWDYSETFLLHLFCRTLDLRWNNDHQTEFSFNRNPITHGPPIQNQAHTCRHIVSDSGIGMQHLKQELSENGSRTGQVFPTVSVQYGCKHPEMKVVSQHFDLNVFFFCISNLMCLRPEEPQQKCVTDPTLSVSQASSTTNHLKTSLCEFW